MRQLKELKSGPLDRTPNSVEDFVLEQLRKAPRKHFVLEVGSGDGWFTSLLTAMGLSVHAFDPNVSSVEQALSGQSIFKVLSRYSEVQLQGFSPVTAPLKAKIWTGHADNMVNFVGGPYSMVVIQPGILENSRDPKRILLRSVTALKPGGSLFFIMRNKKSPRLAYLAYKLFREKRISFENLQQALRLILSDQTLHTRQVFGVQAVEERVILDLDQVRKLFLNQGAKISFAKGIDQTEASGLVYSFFSWLWPKLVKDMFSSSEYYLIEVRK